VGLLEQWAGASVSVMSVHLSLCLSICLSVRRALIGSYIAFQWARASVWVMSVCLSACLSVRPFVCSSVRLFVRPSAEP